jgi:hypothetical protein
MSTKRERSQRWMNGADVERIGTQGHQAMYQMHKLIAGQHPEKNPIKQLVLMKKYGNCLIELVFAMTKVQKVMREEMMMETPNNHLPWTEEEDELVVRDRADGVEIHDIARTLGRTPAAIASRLSFLIGVPRSEIVTAYIDGTLDTERVRGIFHGVAKHVSSH